MQSGVTGINAIRIYNPIKQGKEHDRSGDFIRTYVPELAAINDSEIHEPWLYQETIASKYNIHLDEDYPSPVIDYEEAYKFAKNVLFSFKKDRKTKQALQQVYIKHGSRMKRGKVRSKNEV
jgi:deoxyribodipyrimidine photo-lyase